MNSIKSLILSTILLIARDGDFGGQSRRKWLRCVRKPDALIINPLGEAKR